MIRYLLAIFLVASPCLAGIGIGVTPNPGPGQVAAGGGGGGIILAEQSSVSSYDIAIDLNGGVTKIVGQSFVVTQNGTANKIVLHGGAAGASTITVKIGTTTDLSSTYLGIGTLSYAGGSDAEIEITLDSGVSLSTGTTYYFGVYSDAIYANRVLLNGALNTYADGSMYSSTTGWPIAASTGVDCYFKVTE